MLVEFYKVSYYEHYISVKICCDNICSNTLMNVYSYDYHKRNKTITNLLAFNFGIEIRLKNNQVSGYF